MKIQPHRGWHKDIPSGGGGGNNRQGLPTIRRGSQGLSVAYCQNLLNRRLAHTTSLWVDGIFGPNTHERVKRFQLSKRLVADGIVGPMTWAALEAGPPIIRKRPFGQSAPAVVPATGGL